MRKIPLFSLVLLVLLNGPMIAQGKTTRIPDGFILVEGGTFRMGDEKGDLRDACRPVHAVTVGSFAIGTYEVTQKLYTEVTGKKPSCFSGDNLPIEMVTWYDAIEFCNMLSEREGLRPAYVIKKNGPDAAPWTVSWNTEADGYRLPTEAEWEYAARGGNRSRAFIYSGSNGIYEAGRFVGNSAEATFPVGGRQANELGIYDMSGNVWEWCWDRFGEYSAESRTDPVGASEGDSRVRRGGSAYSLEMDCRVAARGWYGPQKAGNFTGFRLVLSRP